MLVISNRPRASRSADLKLLARLLPELYSTRSNYYYLSLFIIIIIITLILIIIIVILLLLSLSLFIIIFLRFVVCYHCNVVLALILNLPRA